MRRLAVFVSLFLLSLAGPVAARDITIATWNLGWHMDRSTLAGWIDACNETYEQDQDTKKYHPSTQIGAQFGWDINVFDVEGWNAARFPVCDIYGANKQGFGFTAVRVTAAAYEKRRAQIENFIANNLPADIIAFQEVSGKEAVLEVLPNGAADWEVCSFTGFKVQRLAIAWKKALGNQITCRTEDALTLKDIRPPEEQPRPGLFLALDIDGTTVQVLNVHLKSSCVSPIGGNPLAGNAPACQILHDQIVPLETWIEREAAVTDKTILIGDFNRNFWHEVADTRQVRSDGGNPSTPLPPGVRVNSLFEEVIDGQPAASAFTMLKELCPLNQIGKLLCETGETRALDTPEVDVLRFHTYLGCRNPIGLDHVLLGPGLAAQGDATHVSIGRLGGSRHATKEHPEPLLGIADHCPLIATFGI
ncbi:MAG: endonuclease/exonuclease/phosphatase family protein [Mesorhizobium sp.]|uniref:endonuclease/exonuclease/phosphatase family protein n=1 Tax=Mesorhizobium sp. TaxID=1871066 RepID=UPI000FEAAA6F|nr:endonuclease/exonuclease/phosphatase family protein [Mesorhizobium sp.]RWI57042.1 MAG: endonuclease/exonuclease/phosphatase family protein [Mesorhizobium sp.]